MVWYLYVPLTLSLFALEVFLAIKVNDISTVFGYIGTIACTGLYFFLPSLMFQKAVDIFGSAEYKSGHSTLYLLCRINFWLGFVFFGLYLYSNIEAS